MAKRVRRPAPDGEFHDPLKNYDGPDYGDELERALFEDDMNTVQMTPMLTVGPSATVKEVMQKMAERGCACVMVASGDSLYGLFSERDVMLKVADKYDQLKDHAVAEVMTLDLLCAHDTDSPAFALNLMAVQGFRHLPILNVDEKLVGILGPRRVTSYLSKKHSG